MEDERLRISFGLHNGRFCIGDSKLDLTELPAGTREATLTPGDFGQGQSARLTLTYYRTSSHVSRKVAAAVQTDAKALETLSKKQDRMKVYLRESPSPQRIELYFRGTVDARVEYKQD